MPVSRSRIRALFVGGAAIALVTIGAGGTLAASTSPAVWACYNANGQVAMATIPQCKLAGGGQLVQINAAGVPGPTGPQGASGPQGATGPRGAAGALVTQLVEQPIMFPVPILEGTGGVSILGGCLLSGPDVVPQIGIQNDSGAPVYIAGGIFVDGYELVSGPEWATYTGQTTLQAVGTNGSVAATITAVPMADPQGCRFIITH